MVRFCYYLKFNVTKIPELKFCKLSPKLFQVLLHKHVIGVTNNRSIFREAIYVLYGNPILFLLPSVGLVISVTIEAAFVVGLYNNNNQNYFPSVNILITSLFFVAFTIIYFQLLITRNAILKRRLRVVSPRHGTEILLIFVIYSTYALVIVQIGGYEGAVRKSFLVDSDRFSLYVEKLKTSADVIAIIPSGIAIIMFSTIFSIIFNSWMVLVLSRYQDMNMHVFYQSLKDLIGIITHGEEMKNMVWMFVLTSAVSVLEFTLANIAILPEPSALQLYIFQFVISGIIELIYFPFFLTCLYLILLPRTYFR